MNFAWGDDSTSNNRDSLIWTTFEQDEPTGGLAGELETERGAWNTRNHVANRRRDGMG